MHSFLLKYTNWFKNITYQCDAKADDKFPGIFFTSSRGLFQDFSPFHIPSNQVSSTGQQQGEQDEVEDQGLQFIKKY